MDKRTDEKKSRLLGALDQGLTMVHLDARRPGVLVPAELKVQPHLALNLSYRFDPPDLHVSGDTPIALLCEVIKHCPFHAPPVRHRRTWPVRFV